MKERILEILKNNSSYYGQDMAVSEELFEDVAEELIKLFDPQAVSVALDAER